MQSMLLPGTPVFSRLADSGCRDSDLGTGYSWTAAFASRHVATVRFSSAHSQKLRKKKQQKWWLVQELHSKEPKSVKDPSNKLQDLSWVFFFSNLGTISFTDSLLQKVVWSWVMQPCTKWKSFVLVKGFGFWTVHPPGESELCQVDTLGSGLSCFFACATI